MNLSELVDLTGLTKKEFADRSRLSTTTLHRAMTGKPISSTYAQRIVNTLNNELGTNYTKQNLNVNISD